MKNTQYAYGFVLVQLILFALVVGVMFANPPAPNVIQILGYALMGAGLFIVMRALRDFQAFNRTTPNISPVPRANTELVQTGIYAKIRHPIYTGVITALLGVAVWHGSALMWGLVVFLTVFFTVKSYYEESLLVQTYPTYPAYREQAGRFLPKF